MYRIRDLREDRDLSQADIAKVIKTTQQQYSKIETGKIAPSLVSLQKLIKFANISPNELFDYDHLNKEEKLDSMVSEIYKSFSLKQKRALYKFMRTIEELI